MAENFYTILTATGKAKLANSAVLGSKVNFKTLKVGDGKGSYYEPSENQTSLVNQVWSGSIGSISVDENNPNWIVIETLIPATIGGFFIREAGIFDEDDDLIAISKLSETYKPVVSEGSIKDLCIKIILEVSNVESVTLKIDPTVIVASKKDILVIEAEVKDINARLSDLTKNKANDTDNARTTTNKTVTGAINELNSSKANDTDSSRSTTSKTVTGAINELNTNKAPIASPTFTGSVKTSKNTLDDGNGNVIAAKNISIYNSIGFNRNVPNGAIFDSSKYAYQFSHYGSSTATSDLFKMEVYDGSGGNINPGAWCVNGNGYIGINNLSPSYPLDVSGIINGTKFLAAESSTTAGGYTFTVDGAQDTGMFSSGDGQLNFYSNGVLAFTISPGGATQLYGYNIARALSGGYKIQSGTGSVNYSSSNTQIATTVTFPVAFSSNPIVLCEYSGGLGTTSSANVWTDYLGGISTTSASINFVASSTGTFRFSWIAIGN